MYKDSGKRYDINRDEINNDIKDYNDKIISKYDFSHKYKNFINEFNKFETIQGRKKKGAIGFNQKMLLKYGKELKRIIEKIYFNSSGSQSGRGLKILTNNKCLLVYQYF